MTTKADKQQNNNGIVERPFTKGVSGNPNGRPKKGQTITDCVRKYLDGVDPKDDGLSRKEKLVEMIVNMALEGNIPAIKMIWAYIDGLPKLSQEITHKEMPIPILSGFSSNLNYNLLPEIIKDKYSEIRP